MMAKLPQKIAEDDHWWFASRTRALLAMMDPLLLRREEGLRILDIGCGAGNMMHHLHRYGRVTGIDLDPRPVAKARARGYDVHQFDATRPMPFDDASFDVVTALDVIEHNEDDMAILRDARRVTKPGGYIVITAPAFMFLWSHNDDLNAHVRRYSGRELRHKLQQAGYRVIRLAFNNFFVFPAAALLITLRRRLGGEPELASHHLSRDEYQVEMEPASPPVNALLTGVGWLEAQLLRMIDLPFGTSLIAIGCKPQD